MPQAKTKAKKTKYPLATLLNPEAVRSAMVQYRSIAPMVAAEPLPAVFSYRSQIQQMGIDLFYQSFGSCCGASHDKEGEYENRLEDPANPLFDYQWLYAMAKRLDGSPGQEGTMPYWVEKVRQDYGLLPRGVWADSDKDNSTHSKFINIPADQEEKFLQAAFPFRSTGHVGFTTLAEIKQLLYKEGPVTITVEVHQDYLASDSNGVIQPPVGNSMGLHRICIIGWDDSKGLEIMNSWGTSWGQNGFAFFPYSRPWYDGMKSVDFVNAQTTSGVQVKLQYPLDDVFVTQPFGAKWYVNGKDYYAQFGLAGHDGIDFRAKKGTPVKAAADGKVIFAGVRGAYGNCIILQHAGFLTLYGHLDSGKVTLGQDVKAGTVIGLSGNTTSPGAYIDPHLHFGFQITGVTNKGFANWLDANPYFVKELQINLASVASVPGSQLQVGLVKISSPMKPASAILDAPIDSLVLLKDGHTAAYVHKFPTEAKKQLFKQLHDISDDNVQPITDIAGLAEPAKKKSPAKKKKRTIKK